MISGVLRVGSDPDRSDQKIFALVEPLRFACGKNHQKFHVLVNYEVQLDRHRDVCLTQVTLRSKSWPWPLTLEAAKVVAQSMGPCR